VAPDALHPGEEGCLRRGAAVPMPLETMPLKGRARRQALVALELHMAHSSAKLSTCRASAFEVEMSLTEISSGSFPRCQLGRQPTAGHSVVGVGLQTTYSISCGATLHIKRSALPVAALQSPYCK